MDQAQHHPGRVRRTLRHLLSTRTEAARIFPPATLEAIAEAITAGEQTHRGEVRLVVEKSLPLSAVWEGIGNRQRALALFADYGIWDTDDNCGVLLYVNLADRKVDIVADRGINRRIDPTTWQAICNTLTAGFAQGRFHDATLEAIAQVNALLRQHFPSNGARPNELPDRPLML
jgi:uncharacterized membrane protein